MDPQLGSQAVGRGGFSGGAGACQHHGPGPPLAHLIRHLGEPFFMQGFVNPDQLPDTAGSGQVVQIRHGFAFHQAAPALPLRKYAEKVGHGGHFRAKRRILVIGIDEQESPVSGQDVPNRQISGGRHHFSVIVIREAAIGVFIKIIRRPPGQKPRFVHLAVPGILGHRLLKGNPAADQRDVHFHQRLHPALQPGSGKILRILHLDKDTGTQCAIHFCPGLGPQLPQSQKQRELRRADVALLSRWVAVAKQANLSMGGRHGPANGGPVSCRVLFPQRDVI